MKTSVHRGSIAEKVMSPKWNDERKTTRKQIQDNRVIAMILDKFCGRVGESWTVVGNELVIIQVSFYIKRK